MIYDKLKHIIPKQGKMLKSLSYFYKTLSIKVFYFFFVKILQFKVKKIIKQNFYKNWDSKNIDSKYFLKPLKQSKIFNNTFSKVNIDIIFNCYSTEEILTNEIDYIYTYIFYRIHILGKNDKYIGYLEKNLGFTLTNTFNEIIKSEASGAKLFEKKKISNDKELFINVLSSKTNILSKLVGVSLFIIIFISVAFIFPYGVKESNTSLLQGENKTVDKKVFKEMASTKSGFTNNKLEKPINNSSDKIEKQSNLGDVGDKNYTLKEKGNKKLNSNKNKVEESDEEVDNELKKNNKQIHKVNINNNYKKSSYLLYLKEGIGRFLNWNKEIGITILEIFLIQLIIFLSFIVLPKVFKNNLFFFIPVLFLAIYFLNINFETYNLIRYFGYTYIIFFTIFYLITFIFKNFIIKDDIISVSKNLLKITIYYNIFRKIYFVSYFIFLLMITITLFYIFNVFVFNFLNDIYIFDNIHYTYKEATINYLIYIGLLFYVYLLSFQIFYSHFNFYIKEFFYGYKKTALSDNLEYIIRHNDFKLFFRQLVNNEFIKEGNKLFLLKFLYFKNNIGTSNFEYLKHIILNPNYNDLFYHRNITFNFPKDIFYDRIESISDKLDLDISGLKKQDKTSVAFIREKNKFEDISFLTDRINSKKSRTLGKIVINEYNYLNEFSDKYYYLYINLNTILENNNLILINRVFREINNKKLKIGNVKLFLNSKEYKNITFISTENLKHIINQVFNEIDIIGKDVKFPKFLGIRNEKGQIKKRYRKNIKNIKLYFNGIFGNMDFFNNSNKLSVVTVRKNDKENFIYLGFIKDIKIEKAIVY